MELFRAAHWRTLIIPGVYIVELRQEIRIRSSRHVNLVLTAAISDINRVLVLLDAYVVDLLLHRREAGADICEGSAPTTYTDATTGKSAARTLTE